MAAATGTDNSVNTTARVDQKGDPVPAYAFHVEIDGIIEASFTSCSGLNVSRNVEALREGGVNNSVKWIHSGLNFGKVTLESGITHSDALWLWFVTGAEDLNVGYKAVSILQMVPYTAKVARRYNLTNCMAVSWTGPSLNTGSNDAAVETLELAFQSFTLLKGP